MREIVKKRLVDRKAVRIDLLSAKQYGDPLLTCLLPLAQQIAKPPEDVWRLLHQPVRLRQFKECLNLVVSICGAHLRPPRIVVRGVDQIELSVVVLRVRERAAVERKRSAYIRGGDVDI